MERLISVAQELLDLLREGKEDLDTIGDAKRIAKVLYEDLDRKETDLLYKDDKDTPFWQK